jgi:iron complex transport system substrate-binding protein
VRKRLIALLLALLLLLSLSACDNGDPLIGGDPLSRDEAEGAWVTDALGGRVFVERHARVAVCQGSLADCWLMAGGSLVGVTADAAAEQGLQVGDALVVGTVKEVNAELLFAAAPDYVILSADLAAHVSLAEVLKAAGVPYGLFRVDTFEDYRLLMAQLCAVTGRADLFEANVSAVEQEIAAVRAKIPAATDKSVLLMRVYSGGIKAKRDDNLAGQILKEMGLRNVADDAPSLLESLSVEHILQADPDYIFVLTMGSEEGALAYLQDYVENDPAFAGLSAVQNGRYTVLPKDLFHYKPNEHWGESYAYLYEIIFAP